MLPKTWSTLGIFATLGYLSIEESGQLDHQHLMRREKVEKRGRQRNESREGGKEQLARKNGTLQKWNNLSNLVLYLC